MKIKKGSQDPFLTASEVSVHGYLGKQSVMAGSVILHGGQEGGQGGKGKERGGRRKDG
jgi:hypothetical protein